MKFLKFNKKYILLLTITGIVYVFHFAPGAKNNVALVKNIFWALNFKMTFSTPSEINSAKKLPPSATMADIYKEISPLVTKEYFNRVGEMQESMFCFLVGRGTDYSRKGRGANRLLALGESEKAIALINEIKRSDLTIDELELLGISYLRLGEQQNCINMNNKDSCLFPIRDFGIHRLRKGGEEALAVFKELADRDPDHFDWRWLLNVSAMAVGRFPEGVPEKFRLNSELTKSAFEFPRFIDIAKDVGLGDASNGGGVMMDDFNNDGRLDIINVSSLDEGYHLKYFINDGKGSFSDATEKSGFVGIPAGLNMMQADYNNDGLLDILLLRGGWMGALGEFPKSLFRNNGDGTFTEVTKEAGLLDFAPTQAAAWADFDLDGDLDLFFGNESNLFAKFQSRYFENLGNGKFKEVSGEVGLNFFEFIKGAIALDYNNDGWEDLAMSDSQNQKIYLYKNQGKDPLTKKIRFTRDVVLDVYHPFSLASFDYDNDGWPDLLIPGYELNFSKAVRNYFPKQDNSKSGGMKLYRNDHGIFKDVTGSVGLAIPTMTMGLNFGDIDNDGFIDFYLGTGGPFFTAIVPNRMFRNNRGENFQDVTVGGGFGNLQKGHGVAIGDIDGDGYSDIYASLGGVYSSDYFQDSLYHNPGGTNHWIKLKLHGKKSNRFGVGVKIKVTTNKGSFYRHVDTGGSFGANSLQQHIGLGKSTKILGIEVRWPGQNTSQRFSNIAADQVYEIEENSRQMKRL